MPERLIEKPVFWLLLICSVNFLFMLGGHSLWDVDEPNNAVCAREMLEAGNWWVPVFNGDLRFDKPILLYWLMMPAFSVFGVNEFAARLPSALSMTALTFTVFYFGSRLVSARAGVYAALMFATTLHVVVIGRAVTPDPVFMLCICFAMFALFCVYRERPDSPRLIYAAYVAIGFGVLAKGPVAVLMPGLIFLSFLLLAGKWREIMWFKPIHGLLIILAVALPWYITVGVLTDGVWLEGFILHHNIDRFAEPLQGHKGFPGLYLLSLLLGAFPWSGLLLAALFFGGWRLAELRDEPLRLFLLCWIGTFVIFFSIARTQLPNYILPVFPAVALLMSSWLCETKLKRAARWLLWGAGILSMSLLIGAGFALQQQWPGEWVYAASFLPVVAVTGWLLFGRKQAPLSVIGMAMTVCVALLAGWVTPAFDAHKAAPKLAAKADQAGFDGSQLATYRYFQPSLLFYHGGRLPQLGSVAEVSAWMEGGKAVVMPENTMEELPARMRAQLVVHEQVHGLYARKRLLLLSLATEEGKIWTSP